MSSVARTGGVVPKWSKTEDAKLAHLFCKCRSQGGVSLVDLDSKTIKHVLITHFPERAKPNPEAGYKSFAPLFQSKARAFQINRSLSGAWKKRASAKRSEQATSTELASKRRTTDYDHYQANDNNNDDNFEVDIDLEAESVGSDNDEDNNPPESTTILASTIEILKA